MRSGSEEEEKEWKSKVFVSCSYSEEKFQECNKREGVGPETCVATLGVDLRTRTQQLGRREGEEEDVRCEILIRREKSCLPDELHEDWCEEVW